MSEKRPDFLARFVAGVVAGIIRHPFAVLAVAAIVTAAAVQLAYTRLDYHTQRNDLLSADKPCQQRWQKYVDAFGDDDDMVVVAEGTDHKQMQAALDAVAAKVKARPELFDRVFYKVDLSHLRDRALLHLPPEQLDSISTRLDRMKPLLGPFGPVTWRMLSLQSLLGNAALSLESQRAGREVSAADRDLLAQLPAIAHSAAETLHNPTAYRNPWALTTGKPAAASQGSLESLAGPHYFFTPDGSLAMLTCRPRKAAESFTPAKEANASMRAILAEVGPQFPGVALGLTGLPVLETDEMDLSDSDTTRASCMALLGVAVLYFLVYRGARYPLLTITSLGIGTLWALGWATITVGHLNILSATFAVMLIGLGDYGVLWVAQYDEHRKRGESVEDALRNTALHAGPSIITAAATTGLAFFAVMLADFKAVAELGWIAGSGVLFCAASCVLLMPAMIVLVERRRAAGVVGLTEAGSGSQTPATIAFAPQSSPPFCSRVARHPRLVLGLGALLLLGCGGFASRLEYDHNLLNLQPRARFCDMGAQAHR
ncbi:MAG: MMPL family transporter [Gemmataceae bacterium]